MSFVANKFGSYYNRIIGYRRSLHFDGFSNEATLQRIRCVKSDYQDNDYIIGSGKVKDQKVGARNSKRHFSTRAFQNGTNVDVDDWESLWMKFSEDEKLQNALIIDQPLTAEMAYYKGQALNRMGLEYAEDAIRAYRDGIEMSTGGNNEWRSKLEQEIKILEQLLDRQETKSGANLQDYVDHEFDEIFRDLEEQHRLQVKRLQRRREMILAYVKSRTSHVS